MMQQRVLFLCIFSLLFSACVYEDALSDYALNNNLTEDLRLNSSVWKSPSDLVLQVSLVTPPSGESTVYQLGFTNLIEGGTFEAGTTGFTSAFSSPNSAVSINSDSQMTGTNYLELKILRDASNDDYLFHSFDVTNDATSYKFKFDYQHVSYGNLQTSYGETTDDLYWEIKSVFNPSDTVTKTFSVDTAAAAKQFRFGLSEDNTDEKAFHVYLDNIALFEDTGHRISTTGTIGETGVYKMVFYAKAVTSDKVTLELGSHSKTWSLDSTWKEVQVQSYGYVTDGSISMSIIPTGATLDDEHPGFILLTDPKLYLLPDQAAPVN